MSKTVVYTMRREGWRLHWELHLSPSPSAMRQHVKAYYKSEGSRIDKDFSQTLGLVHPYRNNTEGPFAVMFLCEGNLGTNILSHECLHLAMAHERFVLQYGMDYGDDCNDDEERLAYFLGDSLAALVNCLYNNGHIQMPTKTASGGKNSGGEEKHK